MTTVVSTTSPLTNELAVDDFNHSKVIEVNDDNERRRGLNHVDVQGEQLRGYRRAVVRDQGQVLDEVLQRPVG